MKKMILGLITRSISITVVMLMLTLPTYAKAGNNIHHYIDWWSTFLKVMFVIADIVLIALLIYGIKLWKNMSAHHDTHHAGGDDHGGHKKGWDIYKAIIVSALFVGIALTLGGYHYNFWQKHGLKFVGWDKGPIPLDVVDKGGNNNASQMNEASQSGATQTDGSTNAYYPSSEKFTIGVKKDEYFSVELEPGDRFGYGINTRACMAKFAENSEEAANVEWRILHRGDSVNGDYSYIAFRPLDSSENGIKVKYTFKSPRKGARPRLTVDKFKTE